MGDMNKAISPFSNNRTQSRKAATSYFSQLQEKSPDTTAWKNSGKMQQVQWGISTLENQPSAIIKVVAPKSFESVEGKLIKWMGIVVISPFILLMGFAIAI